MPFMAKNAVFKKLAEISDVRALSKQEMEKYDEDLKNLRDAYATYEYAENKGIAKGMKQGIEEGKKQGIKEGRLDGIKETVKRMLLANMPMSTIVQISGLSEEEIRKIKKSLNLE